MNALGGSKVANLSSVCPSAFATVTILKEKTPKINPINFFFHFISPYLKNYF
tara:strand:+ start:93 stop:248 length:156 start_codon:yes stop_codon:yes gene_type:complete